MENGAVEPEQSGTAAEISKSAAVEDATAASHLKEEKVQEIAEDIFSEHLIPSKKELIPVEAAVESSSETNGSISNHRGENDEGNEGQACEAPSVLSTTSAVASEGASSCSESITDKVREVEEPISEPIDLLGADIENPLSIESEYKDAAVAEVKGGDFAITHGGLSEQTLADDVASKTQPVQISSAVEDNDLQPFIADEDLSEEGIVAKENASKSKSIEATTLVDDEDLELSTGKDELSNKIMVTDEKDTSEPAEPTTIIEDKHVEPSVVSEEVSSEAPAAMNDDVADTLQTEEGFCEEIVADERSLVENKDVEPAISEEGLLTETGAVAEDVDADPLQSAEELPKDISVADMVDSTIGSDGATTVLEHKHMQPDMSHEELSMEERIADEIPSTANYSEATDIVDGDVEPAPSDEIPCTANYSEATDIVDGDVERAPSDEPVDEEIVADKTAPTQGSTEVPLVAKEENGLPFTAHDELSKEERVPDGRDSPSESASKVVEDKLPFTAESVESTAAVEDTDVEPATYDFELNREESPANEIASPAEVIPAYVAIEDSVEPEEYSKPDEVLPSTEVADPSPVAGVEDVGLTATDKELLKDASFANEEASPADSIMDTGALDKPSPVEEISKEERVANELGSSESADSLGAVNNDLGPGAYPEELSKGVSLADPAVTNVTVEEDEDVEPALTDEVLKQKSVGDEGAPPTDFSYASAIAEAAGAGPREIEEDLPKGPSVGEEGASPAGSTVETLVVESKDVEPTSKDEEVSNEDTVTHEIATPTKLTNAVECVEDEPSAFEELSKEVVVADQVASPANSALKDVDDKEVEPAQIYEEVLERESDSDQIADASALEEVEDVEPIAVEEEPPKETSVGDVGASPVDFTVEAAILEDENVEPAPIPADEEFSKESSADELDSLVTSAVEEDKDVLPAHTGKNVLNQESVPDKIAPPPGIADTSTGVDVEDFGPGVIGEELSKEFGVAEDGASPADSDVDNTVLENEDLEPSHADEELSKEVSVAEEVACPVTTGVVEDKDLEPAQAEKEVLQDENVADERGPPTEVTGALVTGEVEGFGPCASVEDSQEDASTAEEGCSPADCALETVVMESKDIEPSPAVEVCKEEAAGADITSPSDSPEMTPVLEDRDLEPAQVDKEVSNKETMADEIAPLTEVAKASAVTDVGDGRPDTDEGASADLMDTLAVEPVPAVEFLKEKSVTDEIDSPKGETGALMVEENEDLVPSASEQERPRGVGVTVEATSPEESVVTTVPMEDNEDEHAQADHEVPKLVSVASNLGFPTGSDAADDENFGPYERNRPLSKVVSVSRNVSSPEDFALIAEVVENKNIDPVQAQVVLMETTKDETTSRMEATDALAAVEDSGLNAAEEKLSYMERVPNNADSPTDSGAGEAVELAQTNQQLSHEESVATEKVSAESATALVAMEDEDLGPHGTDKALFMEAEVPDAADVALANKDVQASLADEVVCKEENVAELPRKASGTDEMDSIVDSAVDSGMVEYKDGDLAPAIEQEESVIDDKGSPSELTTAAKEDLSMEDSPVVKTPVTAQSSVLTSVAEDKDAEPLTADEEASDESVVHEVGPLRELAETTSGSVNEDVEPAALVGKISNEKSIGDQTTLTVSADAKSVFENGDAELVAAEVPAEETILRDGITFGKPCPEASTVVEDEEVKAAAKLPKEESVSDEIDSEAGSADEEVKSAVVENLVSKEESVAGEMGLETEPVDSRADVENEDVESRAAEEEPLNESLINDTICARESPGVSAVGGQDVEQVAIDNELSKEGRWADVRASTIDSTEATSITEEEQLGFASVNSEVAKESDILDAEELNKVVLQSNGCLDTHAVREGAEPEPNLRTAGNHFGTASQPTDLLDTTAFNAESEQSEADTEGQHHDDELGKEDIVISSAASPVEPTKVSLIVEDGLPDGIAQREKDSVETNEPQAAWPELNGEKSMLCAVDTEAGKVVRKSSDAAGKLEADKQLFSIIHDTTESNVEEQTQAGFPTKEIFGPVSEAEETPVVLDAKMKQVTEDMHESASEDIKEIVGLNLDEKNPSPLIGNAVKLHVGKDGECHAMVTEAGASVNESLNRQAGEGYPSEKAISGTDVSESTKTLGGTRGVLDKEYDPDHLSPNVLSIVAATHEAMDNTDSFNEHNTKHAFVGSSKSFTVPETEEGLLPVDKSLTYSSSSSKNGSPFISLKEVSGPEEIAEKHVVSADWPEKLVTSVPIHYLDDENTRGSSQDQQGVQTAVTLKSTETDEPITDKISSATDHEIPPEEISKLGFTGEGGHAVHSANSHPSLGVSLSPTVSGFGAAEAVDRNSGVLPRQTEEVQVSLQDFQADGVSVPLSTHSVDLSSSWVSVSASGHAEAQSRSGDSPASFSQRSQPPHPTEELVSAGDDWRIVSEHDLSPLSMPNPQTRSQDFDAGSSGTKFPFSLVLWCSQSMSSIFGTAK